MSKEIVAIDPEGLEIANNYLQYGNISDVAEHLQISQDKVVEFLNKRAIKKYIDTIYLDQGYRNRTNIASLLDEMIASKLEEAEDSGIYTKKDLADLLQMAHRMRMDEIKALQVSEDTNIKNQTNIQINDGLGFGQGNYGKLMEKLLENNT